jgi:hypothetical protein
MMGTSESGGAGPFRIARRQAKLKFIALTKAFGLGTPGHFTTEILVVLALCLAAGAWAIFQFSQFEFIRLCRGFDFWFDSDPARTIANITSRWVLFHERSVLHPLYSLFIAAPFGALRAAFGLSTSTVTTIYVALQSACYAGAAYTAMRAFGLMRFDALLGVTLLYSTAAGIYWIGFPEWIAFGATAVLVSVIWVAAPSAVRNHATGVAQSLISVSMVVTTWVIGIAASLVADWPKLRWRRAYAHTRDALALMAALSVVQYLIFPLAGGFLNIWFEFRLKFINVYPDSVRRSLLGLTIESLGQTLLAPEPAVLHGPRTVPGWGVLIMTGLRQGVPVTPLSVVVLAIWFALWGLGIRAAMRGGVSRAVFVFVVGALAYLYVLHIVFGGEIFLFSLFFAPFMTFIALWSVLSPHKLVARGLCVVLIVASIAHNFPAFNSAVAAHNIIDLSWLDRAHIASEVVAKTDCR